MCDCPAQRGMGWRGWKPGRPAPALATDANWIDLSHPLGPASPRIATFPPPEVTRVLSLPDALLNVSRLSMVVHTGTHVDAPRHFFIDGPGMDEVPLERLGGIGIVWAVEADADGLIQPGQLLGARNAAPAANILLLNTGWHRLAGTAAYDQHPALSAAAAQWIADQDFSLVGLDFPTPDLPLSRRAPDFDFPIHRILLGNGVLIAEHVTNLEALTGRVVEVACHAVPIVGCDGAPARIVARPASVATRRAAR